ncbi:MAG: hypothetical protein CVU78_07830 [Elusimicrobia bacterium HGW-Elusimicrobia-2]|nr:MAG: hypothetical protein CVU78_07830 [Elusimicrobia bacterium HGW-Elusimicrobia-2]
MLPCRGGNVVVISGTTKNIDAVYPVEVLFHGEGLPKFTKFQADSIFTIYKSDLGKKIGKLNSESMANIATALRIELAL